MESGFRRRPEPLLYRLLWTTPALSERSESKGTDGTILGPLLPA